MIIFKLEQERVAEVVPFDWNSPEFFSFHLHGPRQENVLIRSSLRLSADLMRFRLLVLPNSGGNVGDNFAHISNSLGPTFTEYQALAFLQKLGVFDKSVKFGHEFSGHWVGN